MAPQTRSPVYLTSVAPVGAETLTGWFHLLNVTLTRVPFARVTSVTGSLNPAARTYSVVVTRCPETMEVLRMPMTRWPLSLLSGSATRGLGQLWDAARALRSRDQLLMSGR